MKLKKYLFDKEITITDFSQRIGMSRSHMSGVVRGRRKPGEFLIAKIVAATDGEVTEKDLRWKE